MGNRDSSIKIAPEYTSLPAASSTIQSSSSKIWFRGWWIVRTTVNWNLTQRSAANTNNLSDTPLEAVGTCGVGGACARFEIIQ